MLAALSSSISISAAAPSLTPDELPAVTVPPTLKAGLSAASFSSELSLLGPSSVASPSGFSGVGTGKISPLNRPASMALIAFLWLIRANSSWVWRGMLYLSARFSAVSPIERGGYSSAILGFGNRQPMVVSTSVSPPLLKGASGLSPTRGALVMLSTPPAITMSPSSANITLAASLIASRPDEQSLFTVAPGTV